MRRSTFVVVAIVLVQLGSCAADPTLVLRPTALVFGACQAWARPDAPGGNLWCEPGGQGSYDPTGWLLLVALAALFASLVAWIVPPGVLLARAHDRRMQD